MQFKTTFKIPAELCLQCRSAKNLCGLSYCPIIVKNLVKPQIGKKVDFEVAGSSPPSIFVGRYGYPKVKMYPSTPPVSGDTSTYELPSEWLKMELESFLSMRLSILRGGMNVSVKDAARPDRSLHDAQILSMSYAPVDMEMMFEKSVSGSKIVLSEYTPPMGPSAPLKKILYGNVKIEKPVERAFSDSDLKSIGAIYNLYNQGIDISRISKIFSTGAFGVKTERKAVPTRWSITAVDKNLSDMNVQKVKRLETVDKFEVFIRRTDGNLFMGVLVPGNWQFEWGEAWFPGSTWNTWGNDPQVMIDSEGYKGRKEYPDIGGCYYASRIAISEYLLKRQRMAIPILWREIYPNWNLPVGVWYVRENLREMFKSRPIEFEDLDSALGFLSHEMKVPLAKWTEKSAVYRYLRSPNLDKYLFA